MTFVIRLNPRQWHIEMAHMLGKRNVIGLILGPKGIIAKDIISQNRENAFVPKRHNLFPFTFRTFRQMSCNQRFGCLLCSEVLIYEGDGSMKDNHSAGIWSLGSSSTATSHRNNIFCYKTLFHY